MTKFNDGWTSRLVGMLALVAAGGLAACEASGGTEPDPDELFVADLDASYRWVLHGWDPDRLEPIGHAAVDLVWLLPQGWDGEVFRVYGRRSGAGNYILISTVTSCAEGLCRYTDLNVTPGQSYDYFVATVDERTNEEWPSEAVIADVPAASDPVTPAAPEITALDGALYLQWSSTGAQRYRVYLESIDGQADFIEVGETDALGFLDERAENGVEYGYRVVGIDEIGQFSARSSLGYGIPRVDYHAELIRPLDESPAESGFRFRESETVSPIVAGDEASAQWRLERVGGELRIQPLGSTRVTAGEFTTSLTCGPGSEPDCISVDIAPGDGAFSTAPATVSAGNTYVFQVVSDAGFEHYGKIRVQGSTTDTAGETVLVFDWAYQLVPDEPRLTRIGG
jgi:hypothetical protein